MSRRCGALLIGCLLALAAAPQTSVAAGRWALAQTDPLSINYFQGLTHGPGGNVFFDGPFRGFYRTDTNLVQAAGTGNIYPPDVDAIGFNHAGDPTYDPSEGGRLLAPMECYHPDQPQPNTCGIGGFGVLDPVTLAWRYWVRLDQADIPKAMWAEVSPDGQLVWTSSGNDLLAYRTADITAANAATGADSPPIHPVRRLAGAVPPSGVTGGVFVGGRLLLGGQAGDLLQVQSVDLTGATPTRTEIELPGVRGESEGLDLIDMRGGTLHWILSPFVSDPTYGPNHTELLTFVPAAAARLGLRAARRGRGARVTVTDTYAGRPHPVAGASVRAGTARATTSASGIARFARISSGRVAIRATKLGLASRTLSLRRRAIR